MNSLPDWNDLPQSLRTKMVEEAETLDPHCGGDCVVQIYLMLREGLQSDEAPQNMTDQQEHLSPEKWPTRDAWIKHDAAIAQAGGTAAGQWRAAPCEVTREMRYAVWKDQYLYHGATDEQADQLAMNRVQDDDQRRQDERSYRAMLSAAPPATVGVDAAGVSKAAADVLSERRRQVEVERWTPSHDDEHTDGEMAVAAGCYAMGSGAYWPMSWDFEWWKPKTRRQDLVRAGALIIAEIERLDRAALSAAGITDTSASKEAAQDSAPMRLRPISELTIADFGGNVEAFVCELRSRAAEAGVILSDGAAIEAQQKEKP